MGIHEIMGRKHTIQILDVLDALKADWMKVEQFYEAELARGAKNTLTGQPLTEEQAADELWSDLHQMAERLWLRSITREQAEVMEATIGKTVLGRVTVCQGLDFPAYTLTREWDRANSEEKGQEEIRFAEQIKENFLSTKTDVSWWIDKRGTFAKYVLGEFYKSHQAEIDTQDEPEVQEESAEILTPETPDHGTATIKIIGQHVQASYPKDETFRQIVKDMGFRFDSDDIVWVLRCDQFTGGAKDRAAELANELLRAGFSVALDDPEAREMAVAATFEPRTKLWVSILTSGKFGGWLKIALPKERDQERDRLYSEARKLRGAKYDNGYMVIPVSSHDLVEDFAQVNGYKLSEGALEAISRYEAERLGVTPATPTEAERPDVLGDILKSDNAILPDLVDDDDADH